MNAGIRDNVDKHQKIATEYDSRHPEIYNEIEQRRLAESLSYVKSLMITNDSTALDYGCGTGNVTRQLLELGFNVVAADVTPKFVDITLSAYGDSGRVTGKLLNGTDLDGTDTNTFDLVTVYSVLHHIPDYITALIEMCRVLKPGGILFIDHEFGPGYWNPSTELLNLRQQVHRPTPLSSYLVRLTSPSWYRKRWKKFLNPRYQEEGDIHVWPDDHIEWHKVVEALSPFMDVIRTFDYLYYQNHYGIDVYNAYKSSCSDLRELILRKR